MVDSFELTVAQLFHGGAPNTFIYKKTGLYICSKKNVSTHLLF